MGATESSPYVSSWASFPTVLIDLESYRVRECITPAAWTKEFSRLVDPNESSRPATPLPASHEEQGLAHSGSESLIEEGRFMPSSSSISNQPLEALLGEDSTLLLRALVKATKGRPFTMVWRLPALRRRLSQYEAVIPRLARAGAIEVAATVYVLLFTPNHPVMKGKGSSGCCSAPSPHLVLVPMHLAVSEPGLTPHDVSMVPSHVSLCAWCGRVGVDTSVPASLKYLGPSSSPDGSECSRDSKKSVATPQYQHAITVLPKLVSDLRYLHLICSAICSKCRPKVPYPIPSADATTPVALLLMAADVPDLAAVKRAIISRGWLPAAVRDTTQCAAMATRARPRPVLVVCTFLCLGGSAVDMLQSMAKLHEAAITSAVDATLDAGSSRSTSFIRQYSQHSSTTGDVVAPSTAPSSVQSAATPRHHADPLAMPSAAPTSPLRPSTSVADGRRPSRLPKRYTDSDSDDDVHNGTASATSSAKPLGPNKLSRGMVDQLTNKNRRESDATPQLGVRQSSAFVERGVPVVVLGSVQFSAQAILAGAASFIKQPVSAKAFEATLSQLFGST